MFGAPLKKGIDSLIKINPKILDDPSFIALDNYHPQALKFLIAVWDSIYSSSFYVKWDQEVKEYVSKRSKVDINEVDALIDMACQLKFFDVALFDKFSILTNTEIQTTWIKFAVRRRGVEVIDEYMLLPTEKVEQFKFKNERYLAYIGVEKPKKTATIKMEPKVTAEKIPENKPDDLIPGWKPPKGHTPDEILEFINVKWEDRTELFRSRTTVNWYELYVRFYRMVFDKYQKLLKSNDQMSFTEFKEVFGRTDKKRVFEDYEQAVIKIIGQGVREDTAIKERIISYTQGDYGKKTTTKVVEPKILKDNRQ